MEIMMNREREERENEKKSIESQKKHKPFLQKSITE